MSKLLHNHHLSCELCNVLTTWSITQDFLEINYTVEQYNVSYTSDKFSYDYQDNWGLWDYDVCEAFLRFKGCPHYLEIQSSPLSQPFALIIEVPRDKFYQPSSINFNVENHLANHNWDCRIQVALDSIPGNGLQLEGNICCCLGPDKKRQYSALNINSEDKVDFHRPELFVPLGDRP